MLHSAFTYRGYWGFRRTIKYWLLCGTKLSHILIFKAWRKRKMSSTETTIWMAWCLFCELRKPKVPQCLQLQRLLSIHTSAHVLIMWYQAFPYSNLSNTEWRSKQTCCTHFEWLCASTPTFTLKTKMVLLPRTLKTKKFHSAFSWRGYWRFIWTLIYGLLYIECPEARYGFTLSINIKKNTQRTSHFSPCSTASRYVIKRHNVEAFRRSGNLSFAQQ